jgi:hypothetical protein
MLSMPAEPVDDPEGPASLAARLATSIFRWGTRNSPI